MLRIGTLRSSVRRGAVRELAALRHPHLFALAGPAVLGSLEGGLEGQDQRQRQSRMAWIYWVQLWPLTLGPPYSEPSIAGESGAKRRRCLSAASSAPSPDSPRSAGYRRVATARGWRSVSLVTFFARKESDTPPRSRKRISRRANENGTFAGAVSMNRDYAQIRTSRRTRRRSQCSPAPSAATRPPSGCRRRSGGSPGRGCPCGPGSRP